MELLEQSGEGSQYQVGLIPWPTNPAIAGPGAAAEKRRASRRRRAPGTATRMFSGRPTNSPIRRGAATRRPMRRSKVTRAARPPRLRAWAGGARQRARLRQPRGARRDLALSAAAARHRHHRHAHSAGNAARMAQSSACAGCASICWRKSRVCARRRARRVRGVPQDHGRARLGHADFLRLAADGGRRAAFARNLARDAGDRRPLLHGAGRRGRERAEFPGADEAGRRGRGACESFGGLSAVRSAFPIMPTRGHCTRRWCAPIPSG